MVNEKYTKPRMPAATYVFSSFVHLAVTEKPQRSQRRRNLPVAVLSDSIPTQQFLPYDDIERPPELEVGLPDRMSTCTAGDPLPLMTGVRQL